MIKKFNKDEYFMKKAIELARTMEGRTSPDPLVGALVVKNGKIVGKGVHAEFGTPHAEAIAIEKAGKKAKGATLYLNLEPCCHYGNNPPCTDKIISFGIKRVVASMKDPNPLVCGGGFKKLRQAGIEVKVGILKKEAEELNEFFIKFITKKEPFCIFKTAMSLDGKIATRYGESKWITDKKSREVVHRLRNVVDAIMVGVNTVKIDNPRLNVRYVKGKKKIPVKIVIDPVAEIPINSNVIVQNPEKTIVVSTRKARKDKILKIQKLGVKVIFAKTKRGKIDLKWLMKKLGKMNIMSVLIEGGSTLAGEAFSQGIVDKVYFFIAPKIIGGEHAPSPVGGEGISRLSKSIIISNLKITKISQDLLIEGYIKGD